MTGAERARSTLRVDRLAALPVAAGVWFWLKGLAIAAGLAATAVVVVKGPLSSSAPAEAPSSSAVVATIASGRPPPREPTAPPPASASVAPIATPTAVPATSTAPRPIASETASAQESETGNEPPPAATSSLAREAAMLEQARSLLASRPSEALAKLEEHAATFPSGQLGLERELLAIDALRRLGRSSDARARAEALLVRARGGLYEERVRRMLEAMP
jgi:hypothetical protein